MVACPLKDAISGAKKDANVAVHINAAKAMRAGVAFFRSKNSVILTKGLRDHQGLWALAPKCFHKAIDIKTGRELSFARDAAPTAPGKKTSKH